MHCAANLAVGGPQTLTTPSMSNSSLSVSNEVRQTPITRSRKNTENNQKLSAQKLFNQISRAIAVATKHQLSAYEGVDPDTGFSVAGSLDEDGQAEAVRHR